jgi:RimJ/RimL family protein N-acetyltransferase
MPDLMAWAEVAVSGAGGTSYELCYMGLPSLLFVIAHNQQRAAESLAELSAAVYAGAARDFDRHKFAEELRELIESKDRRLAISRRARELVDGLGAERVGASLKDREMKLRPLRETDCRLLFSWANDPVVRNASFHSGPVQWEAHQRWFLQKLQDPQSVIYIGENCDSEPVGQTRFHLEGDRAILSVVIAPNFRGAGWGKELIAFSTGTLVRSRNVRRVEAFVKPDNQASIGLFESVGFRQAGNDEVAGQPALLFVFSVPAKTSKESL